MPNYRNRNTNDVVHRADIDPRLEALDNWERVQEDGLYPSDVDELVDELGRIGKSERDVLRLALAEYDEQDETETAGDQGSGAALFDPALANVDDVNAYLAEADDAERIRVLSLEADESHGGPGRKGILESPHADLGD